MSRLKSKPELRISNQPMCAAVTLGLGQVRGGYLFPHTRACKVGPSGMSFNEGGKHIFGERAL